MHKPLITLYGARLHSNVNILFGLVYILSVLIGCIISSQYTNAANLPDGFTETRVAAGITNATAMAAAPDGRIFVCEQTGRVRVIKNNILLSTPFLTIPSSNIATNSESGLVGIAFDPNYATNRYLYIYYTRRIDSSTRRNRVVRFTASSSNPDVAVAGSETLIFDLNTLGSAGFHIGGALRFGIDGKLYIAVGENNFPSDAQSLSSFRGKMLRINKDGTIPTDNPFYSSASGVYRAIWVRGLRNPFTFDIQPGSGKIFINDVGGTLYEEVNLGTPGANLGWPNTEGAGPGLIYRYNNGPGQGGSDCAIVGSAFYNPSVLRFPQQYEGGYFFGDHCSGYIKYLTPLQQHEYNPSNPQIPPVFATGIKYLVDIEVSPDGSLYYLSRDAQETGNTGYVYRVEYAVQNVPPEISITSPADGSRFTAPATVDVEASASDPDGTVSKVEFYLNGTLSGTDTTAPFTHSFSSLSPGSYQIIAKATDNQGKSTTSLPVTVSVNGPTATIISPIEGSRYNAGDVINYSGSATDPEDGTLPSSAFSWTIVFHHEEHTHPFLGPINGSRSGSFTVPVSEHETSDNVWFRIYLTVTDSSGAKETVYRDIFPNRSTITLNTNPSGLSLTLDEQPVTTPLSFVGVVGMQRSIGAPLTQVVNGVSYRFISWSDGGAANHTITIPSTDTTYTANYEVSQIDLPIINEDCSSISNFTKVRGGTWSSSNGRCVLTSAATSCSGPNCNLLVHNTVVPNDFTLTAQGTATMTSGSWDDFLILFGYQDENNYYYAIFNESDDANTNALFKLQGGVKTQLLDFGSNVTAASTTLYSIRIERVGNSIKVYKGSSLMGTATDSSFSNGRVGLGTYNNNASFDNLMVTGLTNSPTPTATPIVSPTPSPTPTANSIEDDCSSLAQFTRVRGGTWASSNGQCRLSSAATSCSGPNCNILVHNSYINGDFTLTAQGSALSTSGTWDDFGIIFGYQDVNNYYFVNFNESNNSTSNGLFKVVGGVTTEVADFALTTSVGSSLHDIRIEKVGTELKVIRGGQQLAVVNGIDFSGGQVGFAAFNNSANFDNLKVLFSN
jgi:glucose/arabinose dehydrogenase